jgi:hypothetical protein
LAPEELVPLAYHFSRSDDLLDISPFEVRGHPVGEPFAEWHDDRLIIPDQFAAIAAFEYAKRAVGSGIEQRFEQPRRQLAIRASAIWRG